MPMFENLAIRCREVELAVVASSLVTRQAIKATTAIAAISAVNPADAITLMVLVVTVEINLLYLQ